MLNLRNSVKINQNLIYYNENWPKINYKIDLTARDANYFFNLKSARSVNGLVYLLLAKKSLFKWLSSEVTLDNQMSADEQERVAIIN